ncbi:unnamed protein product [Urochloa decumbens]|uniref:Uncharacterized protein n=1 Tax=Urochloa decumbens TaxID=240449 RepID=A0ABC8WBN3_9POAL
MPEYEYDDEREEERVLLVELPSSTRAREMKLTLGKAILTVPVAGAGSFDALTDVLLSHAKVDASGAARLGGLFSSSSCPQLRKLQLRYIDGLTEICLEAAGTLSELRLLDLHDLQALDVAATGLRDLGINGCIGMASARISAPRLETLACEQLCPAERLIFEDAASVRCIEDLHLSHVFLKPKGSKWKDVQDENLSASVWLLRHCIAMDRLQVQMVWPHFWSHKKKTHTKDCLDQNCICNQPSSWESQKLPLERLQNVDFREFKPYDSQIQLVSMFLTKAPALERMTLVLHTRTYQGSVPVPFKIPCFGGCCLPIAWQTDIELRITVPTKYEWTRLREGKEGESVLTWMVYVFVIWITEKVLIKCF